MIATRLDEDEQKTLVAKIARVREELIELGASAVVITASFALENDDKSTGHSYTWASEGNHFEVVGLVSTTLDRLNGLIKREDEIDPNK